MSVEIDGCSNDQEDPVESTQYHKKYRFFTKTDSGIWVFFGEVYEQYVCYDVWGPTGIVRSLKPVSVLTEQEYLVKELS